MKRNPIETCSHAFSRAWRRLPVLASSSDWFTGLSASVVIGRSSYYGFGFTTLETCSNSFYSAIKLNKKLGAYNAVRSYNLMTDYLPVFPNTESREKNLKASSGISQKSDNPNKRVVGGGWVRTGSIFV